MMIDCPRCGFQQPKDDYCANCGINMATYKAEPQTFAERTKKTQSFYLVLAIIVIAIVVLIIKNIETGDEQSEFLAGTPPSSESQISDAQVEKPDQKIETNPVELNASAPKKIAPAPKAPPAKEKPEVKIKSADSKKAQAAAIAQIQAEQDQDASSEIKKEDVTSLIPSAPNIEISFYEIPRSQLQQVYRRDPIVEGANYRIQLYEGDLDALVSSSRALPGTKSGKGKIGESIRVTNSAPANQEEFNFKFEVEAAPLKMGALANEIDLSFSFSQPDDAPLKYQQAIVVPSKSNIIIIGILPHKINSPEKLVGYSSGPLGILDSSDFITNLTEFITVISLK